MIPPADKTELEEFMKKDAGYYDDRTTEFKMQKLDKEDAEWLETKKVEMGNCRILVQFILEYQTADLTPKSVNELKRIAERLAHEASKLQKTLERKND